MWIIIAVLSSVFAGITAILSKCGIKNVNSDVATAVRTTVVLIFSWAIVFITGANSTLKDIELRSLIFLILSGIATGASWLCYYYAIQNGQVSVVVPIDKISILFTVIFSMIVFKEKLSLKAAVGLILMLVGTVVMAVWT